MVSIFGFFFAAHAFAVYPPYSREENEHLVNLTRCKSTTSASPNTYECKGHRDVFEKWTCRFHFDDKTEFVRKFLIYCPKFIYEEPAKSSREEKILRCLKYDSEENMECDRAYCKTYKVCEGRSELQNDSLESKAAPKAQPARPEKTPQEEALDGLKF